MLDAVGRVLLQHGRDPARPEAGTWWMVPGGGAEGGESTAAAARREVWEETGLRLAELGPVVRRRTVRFPYGGREYEQAEEYYVVRLGTADVPVGPRVLTGIERASLLELRWWLPGELGTTDEIVHPPWLAELLPAPPDSCDK